MKDKLNDLWLLQIHPQNPESFNWPCRFSENVYFCKRKYIELKGEKTMAKPIEATPVLEGNDALAFIAEMEKNEKASKEEKMRVKADANSFRAMFHYDVTQLL